MTDIQLQLVKKAKAVINLQGITPMLRIYASAPKSYMGGAYARWAARLSDQEQEIAKRLRSMGADIGYCDDKGWSCEMAGIKSRSRAGLLPCLKHWRRHAENCAPARPEREKRAHSAERSFTGKRRPSLRHSEKAAS